MAGRERALLYPKAGFRGRAVVMGAGDLERVTWRVAHEVLERNRERHISGLGRSDLVGWEAGGAAAQAKGGAAAQAKGGAAAQAKGGALGHTASGQPKSLSPVEPPHLVLIGLQTGGVWWAQALARAIGKAAGGDPPPVGSLDVAYYRDDIGMRPVVPAAPTYIPVSLDGAVVVLCDDVLFTGRTVRAALNAIADLGRPSATQLAVVVDRGHRELPIRPDYVGKNLPTKRDEVVDVSPQGVVVGDLVPA